MTEQPLALEHPVIGVRRWKRTTDGRLKSFWQTDVWVPGVNRALCMYEVLFSPRHHSSTVPDPECRCGLHAYHPDDHHLTLMGVMGIVRGWGTVQCHPEGFRAEYAEILALIMRPEQRYMPELAKRYRVPVLTVRERGSTMAELAPVLAEFGKAVPESVRPKQPHYEFHRRSALVIMPGIDHAAES